MLDYLAGPPDATAAELTALEEWVKDRRAAYFTEKLVEPNAAKAPDDMGIIDFAETDGAIAEGPFNVSQIISFGRIFFTAFPLS